MSQPFHVAFLAEELRRRKAKNPLYSLRAFASFLGINASALSRILGGKQEMSVSIALQTIGKLKPEADEQERFILSIAQEKYKNTLSTLSEGAQIGQLSTALRESELRYENLTNIVDQAVSIQELIRDEAGNAIDIRILRVNRSWENYVGISQEDVLDQPYSKLLPRSFPDRLKLYELTVRTRTAQRHEVYLPERDLWFDGLVIPLEGDRFMTTGLNTTERRRIQERQAYLLGLNNVLRGLADPVEIQGAAARYLGEHLKCEHVAYSEYDQDKDTAVVHQDYAAAGAAGLRGIYRISSFAATLEKSRQGPVIVSDSRTDEWLSDEERAAYFAIGAISMIYVSLIKEGKFVIGFSVIDKAPRTWRSLDVELTQETAELTWSAAQRALAEAALRKSEADFRRQSRFFEATLSSLPDAVYAFDREGKFIFANRVLEELVGLKQGQIIGKTLADLGYPPDISTRVRLHLDHVFGKGSTVQDETLATHPTGKTARYHSILGPVCADDGSVELTVGISRDMTERHILMQELKASETRFALAFDSLPLALGVVDEKGQLILSNAAMNRFLPTGKVPSTDETQFRYWRGYDRDGKLVGPRDYPVQKALRGEEDPEGLAMFFILEDGSRMPVHVLAKALRDSSGRITGAVVVVNENQRTSP